MPPGGLYALFNMYCDRSAEGDWSEAFHRKVRAMAGRSFELGITAEDLPDEKNCVELTDSDGIPAPVITYRMSENTEKIIAFHIERARELADAAAAALAVESPDGLWGTESLCESGRRWEEGGRGGISRAYGRFLREWKVFKNPP